MKLVSALSKRGMSPEDYRSMDMDMQRELWEHCNELIYQMLAKSLGHKYSYLLARVATGDGMGAYRAIKLLNNESSSAAKNQYLRARWLPPAAAGSNARRGRGSKSSNKRILLPLRICAPHLATQLPLFTGPSSPLRAAMCSPQPACRRPCCQNRPPNRPGTMASSPPLNRQTRRRRLHRPDGRRRGL